MKVAMRYIILAFTLGISAIVGATIFVPEILAADTQGTTLATQMGVQGTGENGPGCSGSPDKPSCNPGQSGDRGCSGAPDKPGCKPGRED